MSKVTIPQNIQELAKERAKTFFKQFRMPEPKDYEVGQIWTTKSHLELENMTFYTDTPRIIVILDVELANVIVAPISIDLQFAGEYDLLVQGSQSPLNFDFFIEVWNEVPTVFEHLDKYIGQLDDLLSHTLMELHGIYLTGEQVPEHLQSLVGIFIHEKDVRLSFQEAEVKSIRYLAQANTHKLLNSTPSAGDTTGKIINLGIPEWRSLQDIFTNGEASLTAAASSVADLEEKAYIVLTDTAETVLQLNVSRRSGEIYFIVHRLSNELESQIVVVSLDIHGSKYESEPTYLKVGQNITIGKYKGLNPADVREPVILEFV